MPPFHVKTTKVIRRSIFGGSYKRQKDDSSAAASTTTTASSSLSSAFPSSSSSSLARSSSMRDKTNHKKYDVLPPWDSPQGKKKDNLQHQHTPQASDYVSESFDDQRQAEDYAYYYQQGNSDDNAQLKFEQHKQEEPAYHQEEISVPVVLRETRDNLNGMRRYNNPFPTITSKLSCSSSSNIDLFLMDNTIVSESMAPKSQAQSPMSSSDYPQQRQHQPRQLISGSSGGFSRNNQVSPGSNDNHWDNGDDDAMFDELVSKRQSEVREPHQAVATATITTTVPFPQSPKDHYHHRRRSTSRKPLKISIDPESNTAQRHQEPPPSNAVQSPRRDPPGNNNINTNNKTTIDIASSFASPSVAAVVLPEDPSGESAEHSPRHPVTTAAAPPPATTVTGVVNNTGSPQRRGTITESTPPRRQHSPKVSTLVHQFEESSSPRVNRQYHHQRHTSHGDLRIAWQNGKTVLPQEDEGAGATMSSSAGNFDQRASQYSRRATTGGALVHSYPAQRADHDVLLRTNLPQMEVDEQQQSRHPIFPRTSPNRRGGGGPAANDNEGTSNNYDERKILASSAPIPTKASWRLHAMVGGTSQHHSNRHTPPEILNVEDTTDPQLPKSRSNSDDFDVLAADRGHKSCIEEFSVRGTNFNRDNRGLEPETEQRSTKTRCNSDDFAHKANTNPKMPVIPAYSRNDATSKELMTIQGENRCISEDFHMTAAHRAATLKDAIAESPSAHPPKSRYTSDDFGSLAALRAATLKVPAIPAFNTHQSINIAGDGERRGVTQTRCNSNDVHGLAAKGTVTTEVLQDRTLNAIEFIGEGRARKPPQRSVSTSHDRTYQSIGGLLDANNYVINDCPNIMDQTSPALSEPPGQATFSEPRRAKNLDDPNEWTFWVIDPINGLCHLEIHVESTMPTSMQEFLAQKADLAVDCDDDRSQTMSKLWHSVNHASSTAIENSSAFARNCITPKHKKDSRGRQKIRPSLSFRSGSTKPRRTRSFSFSSVR